MQTRRRSRDADLQATEKKESPQISGVHSKAKAAKQNKSDKKPKPQEDQDMLHLETPSKVVESAKKKVGKGKKTKAIKKNKPAPKGKKGGSVADGRMNLKKFDKLKEGEALSKHKSLLEIGAVDIDGKQIKKLGDVLKGKKLILIVNVASKCGLTKTNYVFMKKMYDKYKTLGLEILAFPCNQFASQEPADRIKIKAFARVTQNGEY